MRLLAQREHSRAELARKLAARLPEEAHAGIPALLDDLTARGWLSDERAAEALVRAHAPRAGVRKLEQALRAKGLAPALVQDALAGSRQSELDRARALWQRRFGELPVDTAGRARQQRFLLGRGFEAGPVARLMRELRAAAGHDAATRAEQEPGDDTSDTDAAG